MDRQIAESRPRASGGVFAVDASAGGDAQGLARRLRNLERAGFIDSRRDQLRIEQAACKRSERAAPDSRAEEWTVGAAKSRLGRIVGMIHAPRDVLGKHRHVWGEHALTLDDGLHVPATSCAIGWRPLSGTQPCASWAACLGSATPSARTSRCVAHPRRRGSCRSVVGKFRQESGQDRVTPGTGLGVETNAHP